MPWVNPIEHGIMHAGNGGNIVETTDKERRAIMPDEKWFTCNKAGGFKGI